MKEWIRARLIEERDRLSSELDRSRKLRNGQGILWTALTLALNEAMKEFLSPADRPVEILGKFDYNGRNHHVWWANQTVYVNGGDKTTEVKVILDDEKNQIVSTYRNLAGAKQPLIFLIDLDQQGTAILSYDQQGIPESEAASLILDRFLFPNLSAYNPSGAE